MKKFITSIFILTLPFGVFAQENNTWQSALGNVSFATDSTWTVSGNGITQIWSDAVQTDYCSERTEFNGGSFRSGFNIDCRSNPDQKGDLFSWQAVYELKNELCPYPWRVPTKQDFIDLDVAFGGTGERMQQNWERSDKYLDGWRLTFGGSSTSFGSLSSQYARAFYWSQDGSKSLGNMFFAMVGGVVSPVEIACKSAGFSLRCVRNP